MEIENKKYIKMRFSLTENKAGERPMSSVPVIIKIVLFFSFILQLGYHETTSGLVTKIDPLPVPFANQQLDVLSMGEPVTLSKMLMLWLQAYDNQPGISIPFIQLDYGILIGWLNKIIYLDPYSHYPLLSASRIYSEVPDEDKKREILEFVYQKFVEDPANRWQWMAHAVYVAKHRLLDKELALKYARELRIQTTNEMAPQWARQMELFVMEDIGDIESAQILLGGLIESGEITDASEIEFLTSRLGMTPDQSN